ncbi:conserved unknown protein [Chrysochromulina tobinii]|uniref:PROP1-like PPR domain-containing protein n=1 Tax=Chrysochromulina tobinii TaxID=1460289 RepID=A0A0M0JGN5_9EUKA|nr:conserved unknown protein [Chrysochromulina tobinii]|eukprot:KOO25776.1 conserved unknown protein [Chrysochromulina sp. CCMP291]
MLARLIAWQEAVDLLREQRALSYTGPELLPSYRAAITSVSRAGRWRHALKLVDELAADGVVADPICFSEAMGACRKSGQWKITLKLLADMREAGAPPDPYTTSNAIAACAAGGQWEQALELLDELEEPNAVCYNAALSACARAGRWREALTLLKRLEDGSGASAANARSYASAMTACTRGKQWQRALQLWDQMQERGIRPDGVAYGAAVAACCEGRQATRALRLVQAMRSANVRADAIVFNSALSACARNRPPLWKPARQLLRDMQRWGVPPTTVSYNAALAAAAAARNWKAALRLMVAMRAEGLTPDTTSFGTALSACERARNWQAARTVLDEARAAEAADIECFNSAISAVARGQGWKAALALLREAEVAGLPPTARSYGPVLLAARRQPKVVAKLVQDEIRPRGLRLGPFSGSAVISAFGAAKQWRAAVGALELIEEPNAACFTAAAAACGRSRQSSAALELLDRMEAVGVVPDGRALQTIAWAAARGGEYAASLATLRRLRTSDGRPLAPADSLGVALSVCESMEAIFELIRAAEASGLAVDPLTLYQVVLEGWAAGAEGTAQSPVAAAASLLRGLGDGSLPAHGDGAGDRDEALDAMIEAADDADEALDDVEAELGSRYDDDEEDEEEDAFVDNDDGGEGFAFEEDDDEGGGELWLLPVAHVEALLDRAYAKMVTAGQLSPWTAEAMLDLHGYSVALAGAAIRYVLRTLAHEHAERAALGAVDGGRCADGLVVITGRGRGSGEEGPQLGSAVLELLAHGLDPPIEARVLAGNEGRVNLDGESLQRWLKEGGRVLPKEIIE